MQDTSIKFLENPQKGIQKTGVSSITILRLRHPEQSSFHGRIVHREWQNTGNEKSWGVTSCSVRVAGDKFDEAIISYVKKKYNLLIGERTAEEIKIAIGSAFPTGSEEDRASVEIKGRNLVDGLPKNVTISAEEVREALSDPLAVIVDAIKSTLEKTPPELSADIIDHGIMLTGGGALLRGLDQLVEQETGMPVHVADSPLDCVVDGTGKRLEVSMPSSYYKARR